MESILPMVAAYVMEHNGASREPLFYLLVLPPMLFSVVQVIAWTSFDLTPRRVSVMRRELQEYHNSNKTLVDMLDA